MKSSAAVTKIRNPNSLTKAWSDQRRSTAIEGQLAENIHEKYFEEKEEFWCCSGVTAPQDFYTPVCISVEQSW